MAHQLFRSINQQLYFSFCYTTQTLTIGCFSITRNVLSFNSGGNGARVDGKFQLTAGESLQIVVGKAGAANRGIQRKSKKHLTLLLILTLIYFI